ncbi:MAG TPA: hypothetical protein VFH29_09235 [Anaerolineales bacterium]|nr:hypothetical protein [Anaerolineales bacterium]
MKRTKKALAGKKPSARLGKKSGAGKATKSSLRARAKKPLKASRVSHVAHSAARDRAKAVSKTPAQIPSRSVAKLAASVLSRRAAKVEAQALAPALMPAAAKQAVARPVKAKTNSASKRARHGAPSTGRPHGAASLPGNRPLVKAARMPQFNYMKAPGFDHGFDVGDSVEVFCDHEEDGERVRGWIKGVVVQVDNKLVAVQFRSNVFLTDGWMVPDRILWYALASDQIRNTNLSKRPAQAVIPEY